MHIKKMVLGALLGGLSFSSLAAVTLQVPDSIDLLAANEAKPQLDGGLFSSSKTLTLPDGENQIVFRYKAYFNQGDERIVVPSNAIIAKFSATDSDLEFVLPEYQNQQQAQQNIANLSWKLVDQTGLEIGVTQDKLIKNGLQVGRDYAAEAQQYNAAGGVAAFAAPSSSVTPTTAANAPIAAKDAEEMLHFWYEKADADTKARFKRFVNQQ